MIQLNYVPVLNITKLYYEGHQRNGKNCHRAVSIGSFMTQSFSQGPPSDTKSSIGW